MEFTMGDLNSRGSCVQTWYFLSSHY